MLLRLLHLQSRCPLRRLTTTQDPARSIHQPLIITPRPSRAHPTDLELPLRPAQLDRPQRGRRRVQGACLPPFPSRAAPLLPPAGVSQHTSAQTEPPPPSPSTNQHPTQPVFVDLKSKPEWFFPWNPYGRVPTLVWRDDAGEHSLYEVGGGYGEGGLLVCWGC